MAGMQPGMAGMQTTRLDAHTALTAWVSTPFSWCVLVVLALIAVWYVKASRSLTARGRRWPVHQTLAFGGGLVSVELALQSPIATFAGSIFTSHILQHLILMSVAPPLLAWGAPSTLLLQTSTRQTKTRWLRIMRSRGFAAITHPLVVWWLYYGVMFAFFLTPLIGYAMEHMALMDALNVTFLAGGTLFWWPVIGRDPITHWKMGYPGRLVNLLIGVPIETWLGISIMSAASPIAPMYSVSGTHSGGAVLWILSELLLLPPLVYLAVRWARSEERAGLRFDQRDDRRHGVQRATEGPEPVAAGLSAGGSAPLSRWEEHWIARTGAPPPRAEA